MFIIEQESYYVKIISSLQHHVNFLRTEILLSFLSALAGASPTVSHHIVEAIAI